METFRAKCVEICLRAIYLQPNCAENCQDRDFGRWWNSKITNNLHFNCAEYGLQNDL